MTVSMLVVVATACGAGLGCPLFLAWSYARKARR